MKGGREGRERGEREERYVKKGMKDGQTEGGRKGGKDAYLLKNPQYPLGGGILRNEMDHMGEAVVDERMESLHKDHCWEECAGSMLLVHAISLEKKNNT